MMKICLTHKLLDFIQKEINFINRFKSRKGKGKKSRKTFYAKEGYFICVYYSVKLHDQDIFIITNINNYKVN